MDNSRSSSQIFIPDFDSYEYDAAYATFNREQNRDWIGGDIPDVLEDNRHLMRSNMIEDVEYGHEFQNGAIKPLPSVPASRRVTWASNLSIDSKQSNHNNPQQHEKLSKSSSSNTVHDQRYCCGLFRTRKSCFSYCAPITLVLLIALGILGYFIFPRMPELQVGVPKSFEFVQLGSLQEFQSANPSKPFTANFTVDVNVGVDSSNLIDWKLDLIETEGFLIHPKNYKSQEPTSNRIGYGASRNIIIKSNAKTNIPFVIDF